MYRLKRLKLLFQTFKLILKGELVAECSTSVSYFLYKSSSSSMHCKA